MKSVILSLVLAASASSAFGDATQFLPPRAPSPSVTPGREPSRYPPYNRGSVRSLSPAATPAPRADAPAKSAGHFPPYDRSKPRFTRTN